MRYSIATCAVVLAFDVIIVANSDFIGTWLGSFDCKNVTYNVRLDITNEKALGAQLKGLLNYWNDEAMVSGAHEVKGIFSRNSNTFTMIGIRWIEQPVGQKAFFVLADGNFDKKEHTISTVFQAHDLCISERTTLHQPKIPTTKTPVVTTTPTPNKKFPTTTTPVVTTTPKPRPIPSPWNCIGWGDPHYNTFDGFRYDFQGDCKYSLVRDINGSFEIEVKNVRAFHFIASSVSVTKYADVYVGNDVIRLGPGTHVKVNSTKVILLPHNSEFYSIDVSRSSIQFNCPMLSLNVVFNFGISVSLGEQWRNKVDGLCKNFDGNLTNDQSDASGTDISGQQNMGTLLGDSYQVLDPEEPKCISSLTEDLPDTCKNEMAREEAEDVCEHVVNSTGPFAECVKRMSEEFLQDFVEDCMVDYCDNPDNGCDIVSKFAEEACTQEAVDIPIWRDDFNCKMECGENEEYLTNGPGCETKCLEKEQKFCNTLNREGCFCKTGYIRCEGKCIVNKEFRGSWLGSFDCNNITYNVSVDITNVGGHGVAPKGVLNYWNKDAMIDGSHELKGVLSRNTFTLLGFNWIKRPTGQKAFFVLSRGEFNDEEQTFSAAFQSYDLCISERTTLYRVRSE